MPLKAGLIDGLGCRWVSRGCRWMPAVGPDGDNRASEAALVGTGRPVSVRIAFHGGLGEIGRNCALSLEIDGRHGNDRRRPDVP